MDSTFRELCVSGILSGWGCAQVWEGRHSVPTLTRKGVTYRTRWVLVLYLDNVSHTLGNSRLWDEIMILL